MIQIRRSRCWIITVIWTRVVSTSALTVVVGTRSSICNRLIVAIVVEIVEIAAAVIVENNDSFCIFLIMSGSAHSSQSCRLLGWPENSICLEGLFRTLSIKTDDKWMTHDRWLAFYKRGVKVNQLISHHEYVDIHDNCRLLAIMRVGTQARINFNVIPKNLRTIVPWGSSARTSEVDDPPTARAVAL